MSTITIDMNDGTTAPMTPPPALGPAFAQFIAKVLAWDDEILDHINDQYLATGDDYDDAYERVEDRLVVADVYIWSCTFGQEDEPDMAGPYIDTVRKFSVASAEVACFVLARDLGLVTEDDFKTMTGWWVAAGLPDLPPARDGATFAPDQKSASDRAWRLHTVRDGGKGWPLSAVKAGLDA